MSDEKVRIATVFGEPPYDIGEEIKFRLVDFFGSDGKTAPGSAINWDIFEGAVLGVAIKTDMSLRIVGSAFLVAPGVAISATHVLEPYFPDIESGAVVIYGVGILEASASLWSVEKLDYNCSDDICLISVVPFTETPSHRTFFQFGLTTRCPDIGENLHLVGFRDFGSAFSDTENPEGAFRANMMISAGSVTAVYPEKRDSVLMPFPTIEIGSGSTGGMSGGVALTSDGKVVGVISRGLSTDDHQGPTFVSWIINCLNRPLEITWPRGLHSKAQSLLEIDEKLIFIEGRGAIILVDANTCIYKPWFK